MFALTRLLARVGWARVGPVLDAMLRGDAAAAANNARVVAETVAMQEAIKAARKRAK